MSEHCIDSRSRDLCHVDLAVRASPWHGTDSNRTRNNSRLRTNSVWHPNIELQSGKVLHPLFEKDWRPVLSINTAIFWLAGAARVSSFERRAAFSPSPACATAAFRRAQPGVSREQARDGRVLQQSRAVQHTGPARAVVACGTCLRSGSSCDRSRRHLSFLRLTRTRLVLSLSLSLFLARVVSCRRAGPPNTARRDVVRARDSVPRGARRPAEPHRPV